MGKPSDRRRWGRAARYFAWFAAAIAAAVVAAALILPEVIDAPAVKAELQRKLSETVQGEVAWEDLDIRILPSPRAIVRKARVEVPGSLEVNAEELAVRLAFWPLLRGRVEIVSVSLSRPAIHLDIAPAPDDRDAGRKADDAEPDLATTWRLTAGAVAGIVRRFAPDTVLSVDDARLEFSAPGILPIALHDVAVRARTGRSGLELDASLAGTHWSRVKLAARVQFADLSGQVDVEISGLKPQPWLDRYLEQSPIRIAVPAGDLRLRARIDGKTELDGDFELRASFVEAIRAGRRVRVPDLRVKGSIKARRDEGQIGLDAMQLGVGHLSGGTLRYSAQSGAATVHAEFDLDTAQTMENARRLAPEAAAQVLARFQPEGRVRGTVKVAVDWPDWSLGVDIAKSDASVRVRELGEPVRLARGMVEIDRHAVRVSHVAASVPAGRVLLSTLRHSFKDGSTEGDASFDLDLAQWLDLARRALPPENRDALADIETAAGRVQGNARFEVGRGDWKFGLDVPKTDVSLGIRNLPGPIRIAGWSFEAGPASATLKRAAVSLLDARLVASVTFDEFETGPRARGAIVEGTLGEKYLAWVWQTAQLPPNLEPATPVRITAPHIARRPGGDLEVRATAQFGAGPAVTVDLGWAAGALDIRRATVKDRHSDAALALRAKRGVLEGRYSGALYGTTIAAVLKRARVTSGAVAGDLKFTFDRANPKRMVADGHLKGEALDLAPLIGQPLKIERIELATDDTALQVREAAVEWAGQRVTLRGSLRRSEGGPVIDAQLASPGINLDALLPAEEKPAADVQSKSAAGGEGTASRIWPLPVTGRIAVRSDFIQRGRHRVAPLVATLSLEERRAHLDLEQAELCGISLPLTLEATPQGYSASARIAAEKRQLEQTAHCLSGEHMVITGAFDLKADLSTQGKLAELRQNLKGTVRADVRDGNVMKFALLGNILSLGNVASLMKPGGPRLDEKGFPYRNLVVAGRFDGGRFIVDEGAFRSDAVGLAATGWISLNEPQSRLTVLVAPFSRVDELVRKVPVFGYVIGGVFTSVPVGVSGDIRDPLVVPLGPGAITSEVLGIFERTLKLPAKLVTPLEGK